MNTAKKLMLLNLGGAGSSGEVEITYLLRDEFTTDESAPLTSPRTCEPGPGTLVISDVENLLNIAGDVLLPSAKTTGTTATPQFYENTAYARAAGLAVIASRKNLTISGIFSLAGWATSAPPIAGHTVSISYMNTGAAQLKSGSASGLTALSVIAFEPVGVILRSAGELFVRSGILEWVDSTLTDTNLYPVAARRAVTTDDFFDAFEFVRVAALPAPFDSDFGIATERLAGARAANDTFTHEADCLIEFVVAALPASDTIDIRFRMQDANNYWQVTISSTGALDLDEIVAGTPTERGTAAAAVSNGHRVVITCDGTTIQARSNNGAAKWSYASAANFATATAGLLATEGTGGSVTDIVSWPRTLSGLAKTVWDAACATNP